MDSTVVKQIILLFATIAIGYAAGKCGVMDAVSDHRFSRFLVRLALPANILYSAGMQSGVSGSSLINSLLIIAGIYILLTIVSNRIAALFRLTNTYQLMMNYSNLGFMGLPIIESIYGHEGVFYVVLFMLVLNIHLYSVGVITLKGSGNFRKAMTKNMLTPGVISSVLALAIVLFQISLPEIPAELLKNLGSLTTPMAMLIIGSQLSRISIAACIKNKALYLMTVFKLVLYPAMVLGVLKFTIGTGILTNVAAILIGLPVAGNVTMLCSEYDGDVSLAAQGIGITSLCSIVTIPIMLWLIC